MRKWIIAAVLLAGLSFVPDDASARRPRIYGGFRSYYPSVGVYVGPRTYGRPYYYNNYYRGYYGPSYYGRGYYGRGWPRSYYYTPGYYTAPLYRSGIHWYW